ncbi:MAG: SDR family oxidoreductase [Spirochaetes bacterium]|nr:SDR family oxidoreductase [Spirochaetota bacterium]MBU1078872.1 SDR family oxidoreductase [Spirochaetota bacterium]
MPNDIRVLLLGGTGRTGGRVLARLLERGVEVRAIVRSARRLEPGTANDTRLTAVEADPLSLPRDELLELVRGCDAVVSCLGHNTDLGGIFGPPRDLVARMTRRACGAVAVLRPAEPVKFVLMSSVSVNRPDRLDTRRGAIERAAVALLRGLVPPAKDNQDAADFLCSEIGQADRFVRWVAVRPDTLVEGDGSGYALHEGLVSSLARPDKTSMANVARFMCELVTDPRAWDEWAGRMPVIVDAAVSV